MGWRVFGSGLALAVGLLGCGSGSGNHVPASDASAEMSPLSDAGGAETSPPADAVDAAGARDAGKVPLNITWALCPTGFVSECAHVAVPLDWNDPSGPSIVAFMSRFPARVAATGQLWLLQGGPGASGEVFATFVEALAMERPDLDIYVLEHRGVGESTRLGCPTEEDPTSPAGRDISPDEWASCIDSLRSRWGAGLAQFSTTQAAEDLAHLAEATRAPGQKLFVYGVSYGTMWAMRFMQVRPADADGVMLDSVVAPGNLYLSQFDQGFDPVAAKLAALCGAEATCGAKLGPDPWTRIAGVFHALDQGACPALGVTRAAWSTMMSALLENVGARTLVFPLFYRLERCTPDDVTAIQHFVGQVFPVPTTDPGPQRSSLPLQYNIALSELWETPAPDAAEVARREGDSLFWPGLDDAAVPVYPLWPRYALDGFSGHWPSSAVPVLAMNGTFDPQTPIEQARGAAAVFTMPHQGFVEFAEAPHGVVFTTPVNDSTLPTCGLQMLMAFLADPDAPPATACLADLAPVDLHGDDTLASVLFGQSDLWENAAASPARGRIPKTPPPPAHDIDWDAVARAARQRAPLLPAASSSGPARR